MESQKSANQLYKESGTKLSFKEWLITKKNQKLDNFAQLVSNDNSKFLSKFDNYKKPQKSYNHKNGTHCYYCDLEFNEIDLKTIDHIIPTSKGGRNTSSNKVSCCSNCNVYKSNLSLTDFIKKLKQERKNFIKKNEHQIYQCQKLIPKSFINWLKFLEK